MTAPAADLQPADLVYYSSLFTTRQLLLRREAEERLAEDEALWNRLGPEVRGELHQPRIEELGS